MARSLNGLGAYLASTRWTSLLASRETDPSYIPYQRPKSRERLLCIILLKTSCLTNPRTRVLCKVWLVTLLR